MLVDNKGKSEAGHKTTYFYRAVLAYQVWFYEHTGYVYPSNPNAIPRYFRWEGYRAGKSTDRELYKKYFRFEEGQKIIVELQLSNKELLASQPTAAAEEIGHGGVQEGAEAAGNWGFEHQEPTDEV
ncbi:uncharacterized protein LOC143888380 isoform X2 [Tasmannia lanceolata]|uniref:uncharacterized protein LOC143888380 isoform X2 n=1 Tax=Tasmannia lanceolata TaxID=3420 RepID=UPI00406283EA